MEQIFSVRMALSPLPFYFGICELTTVQDVGYRSEAENSLLPRLRTSCRSKARNLDAILLVHAASRRNSHNSVRPSVMTAHRHARAYTPVALASRQLLSRQTASCWQHFRLAPPHARTSDIKQHQSYYCVAVSALHGACACRCA